VPNDVNFTNLNPISFLDRSATVYPNKPAIIYGKTVYTYSQFSTRVNSLAGALFYSGVRQGDRVAFLAPNTPSMLEGHYGPLKIGAILVAINIRLSAREIAYILNHSGAKTLIFDSEFSSVIEEISDEVPTITNYVQIVDTHPYKPEIGGVNYEEFLASGTEKEYEPPITSEKAAIAINYTSGTTGRPKGVQYNSRGAYLAALGEVLESGLTFQSKYLWTLPMFHCNGWCFTWAVTAVGGTHVCLRKVEPATIFQIIQSQEISHMCCAPTVLTSMYSDPMATGSKLDGLTIMTAGAPPAPQVIRSIEGLGANILHAYGLTETYGPHTICAPQPSWSFMSGTELAEMKSRQGVPYIIADTGLRVVDQDMRDVKRDSSQMGEVVMRGNNVMSGYFEDEKATSTAFEGGWFHSGDIAIWHPDGYIELQDRAKDVIISGGENISSQEVEKVIMEHDEVLEVSVVGVPDSKWGEVPKAFVTRKSGSTVSDDDIINFTRDRIAHFKAPKFVEFGDLPKTATGKIQKFVLREKEWKGKNVRIQGSTLQDLPD
jgi:fatty-acyl-CoA synthase